MIALPCIAISSSSQYNLTVTTVDPQKWERFTSQLVNISGVNIVIEKSSIDKLNLQNINNGNGIKSKDNTLLQFSGSPVYRAEAALPTVVRAPAPVHSRQEGRFYSKELQNRQIFLPQDSS